MTDILGEFERYEREHEERWRAMSVPQLHSALSNGRCLWRDANRSGFPLATRRALSAGCGVIRAELLRRRKASRASA